jgi:hypothetical protein
MHHTRTQKAIGLVTITAILMAIALLILFTGCSKSVLKLSNNRR